MSAQKVSLCKDSSKIIFVSGFGGQNGQIEGDVRESAWKLHSFVYAASYRVKSKVMKDLLYIVNKSKSLKEVSAENKQELLEMLYMMPLNDGGGDDSLITRVIFAHSHGAKIVYEALKQESLQQFLFSKGVTNITERILLIRSHLAVFTMGGIHDVPKHFAKICYNMYFKDDGKAQMGKIVFGDGQEGNVRAFGREDSSTSVKEKLIDAISSSAAVTSQVYNSAVNSAKHMPYPWDAPVNAIGFVYASAASCSGSLLSSGRHYIDEYLGCEELTDEILNRLGLETKKDA